MKVMQHTCFLLDYEMLSEHNICKIFLLLFLCVYMAVSLPLVFEIYHILLTTQIFITEFQFHHLYQQTIPIIVQPFPKVQYK